ncbi:hypothetical protein HYH02_006707 [Chlamydomonas schloesseri]|uniref:Uncharacterized protein n=1 Tax=Chlamydomonas schloesseri TaxID=2026947 RepID=A0A835WIG1_9CHLO|nr:hypothetical protein HYH02_006707 [Chlamydomonas schloesseri]|eukprot:KAG2448122.1 hypothetical protein HYH02_006707 [Chlamydomonas schloesseri]
MRARALNALRCVQQCSQLGFGVWSQVSSTCAASRTAVHCLSTSSHVDIHPRATALTADAVPAALVRSFACSGILIHSSEGDDDGI